MRAKFPFLHNILDTLLQMELEQSSFLASPEALAAIQAVEAGELEVIGSLADFNWLIDELTAN